MVTEQQKQKVLAGIERASQLMNSEYFNQLVESKAPHGNKRGVVKSNGGGTSLTSDLAAFESQAGLSTTPQARVLTEGRELPDFNTIKESMRKQPTPPMDSISMMAPPASFMQQPQQQQAIRETVQQPVPVPQYVPQGIDYNYIKYIVNECIRESLSTQLNESTNLTGLRMAGGNKIQFVDRKGNVYEGVLTLKKKAEQ